MEHEENLREHTLSSEHPYRGRRLSVRVDEVCLPGGRQARREIVEHPEAVAAVPLLPDGRVVLVRQWRHPAGRALLETPAGVMEEGETPSECILRELMEEIHYRAGQLTPLFSLYLAPGYSEELLHVFLAEDLVPERAACDDDENLQIVTLPLEDAVRLCLEGGIGDAKSAAGLLAVARLRGGRWAPC